MATNSSLKNQLIEKEQSTVNVQETIFKNLINSDDVKSKFTEVLKDKALEYINSIISLVKETPITNALGVNDSHQSTDLGSLLIECEPRSIIDACMIAASLDLSIDKNLEHVWIITYKKKANFQLGYKGYIQLLLRTGEYKAINVIEVYEGQLKSWNPLTEKFDIDVSAKKSDAVIGYAGYFEMVNGFRKYVYWSKDNMDTFKNNSFKGDPRWNNDYKAMAKRTVMRNMLSKWGRLSAEMQRAYLEDINTDKFINGN
ncbi:recombinase RecT [Clostridium sp. YIM B02500]|uniref:recombinase RecT n=1 Tax=Clostridium sp. YIM B02500 TaxID=2910681 RepID=UPI001EEE1548|nr:recombinase RecT [Clostridium sp. YIM B02500]